MPIPLQLPPSEEIKQTFHRELRLVQSPSLVEKRPYFYPRAFAHFIDLTIVQGLSLYSAKWGSTFLISYHLPEIQNSGRMAGSLFRDAFQYANGYLFWASFLFFAVTYFVLVSHAMGRTLGQGLLGFTLVDRENNLKPTVQQHFLRFLGCVLGYASGGILCLLGLREGEGKFLQDELSGTRLIRP